MTLEEKYLITIGSAHGSFDTLQLLKSFRKEIEAEMLANWDKEVYYRKTGAWIHYYNKYKKFLYQDDCYTEGRLNKIMEVAIKEGLKPLPKE